MKYEKHTKDAPISDDALRELLAKATPGPWQEGEAAPRVVFAWQFAPDNPRAVVCECCDEATAELIALAPQLAAEVLARRAALAAKDAEIARLTAQRNEAIGMYAIEVIRAGNAEAALAEEKAKRVALLEQAAEVAGRYASDDCSALSAEMKVLGLDTEATAALDAYVKQAVEAETRACAALCDKMSETFGAEEYAVGQPLSSFSERFACGEVKTVILARLDQPEGESGE